MTLGPDHPSMQDPAWVYVFKREDGLRKVGLTTRLGPRRWEWKMATGLKHTLECAWPMKRLHAMQIESQFHYKRRRIRVRGHSSIELYTLPLREIVAGVEAEIARHPERDAILEAWNEHGTAGAARKLKLSKQQILRRLNRIRNV